MIIDIDEIFQYKKMNKAKLLEYGFVDDGKNLQKQLLIMKQQFTLVVTVKPDGRVSYQVMDNQFDEEYVLVHAQNAQGGFVAAVRDACEKALNDIAQKCFDTEILQAEQTKRIVAAIAAEYGAAPEFLWDKYPDNAAFRRKDNAKWFALILTVDKSKLGLDGNGSIEIMDIKALPESVVALLKQKNYYPAYHMNKKHWFTVCLNGSIPDATLRELIDISFRCAADKSTQGGKA